MAEKVPEQLAGQSLIFQPLMVSPFSANWFANEVITNIPAESVGWLVAQGWRVTGITYDDTTVPPTPYYALTRESLQNWNILQSLLGEYTTAHNLATTNNAIRYNDILTSWAEMLHTSHDHFDVQFDEQDDHAALFLGDLQTYMDDITALIDQQLAELAELETNYTTHSLTATGYLLDLGTTELARINEAFDATLSQQLQQLTDRGLYSSAVAADITARNARDRNQEIVALNDRLNREKWENQHKIYEQQTGMKRQKMDEKTRAISGKIAVATQRLAGLQQEHDEWQRLMAYQLDERNKILVGIYGFVERRDDVYPSFENMVQIAVGLGDAGGAWISP